MEVKKLTLTNFRNYENETITFHGRTNLIYGDNAQGKTNILEAIYTAANGRSHRCLSESQMIRFGSDFAQINLEFKDKYRDYKIVLRIIKDGKKSIYINNVPIKKLSVLVNYLNVVMFSPEDLDLLKGAPKMRRRFLDTAIGPISPRYISDLINYNKALSQKNALLKCAKMQKKTHLPTLDIWNEQLAQSGAKIIQERFNFINQLEAEANKIHQDVGNCSLNLKYLPGIDEDILHSENMYEYFLNKLSKASKREIENGSSLYGIQRDDIAFYIDNKDAKMFASQGQQRTIVLCMKLALTEYIKEIKDEYPVLLFDDIMSELDENHRKYMASKILDKQVILTCTDKENSNAATFIKIQNGKVVV